ncbi:alpha/beta fold hydrolase [Trujillonella endophytica]|uniref:Pimeloyl-ACP methyl ester carboxylesterase n=1 Tax=Trujillonella endophytica TaxID=673521 RepID=A0A1H8UCP2_9ACTN|nr:alpha/beta hydrolase [Trujillella endophytica]SEP00876.1 Pimeloyl-ACP methyl ester carboxylesterase [Trujillella endophytica]
MQVAEVEVNGGIVVHEFVGPEDGEVVVLTPGGRFSKDYPGVRELAEAIAEGGKRVLLWDRPNCGASDIQVYGRSESHMRAHTLGLLLEELGIEKVVKLGGSGGARDSVIFALMYPEKVSRLGLWNIVGGNFSTMSLAGVYILNELRTVRSKGIEGVIELGGPAGGWCDLVAANPRNADRLRAIGAEEFERVMDRWLDAFIPKPNEAIPGVPDWEFGEISVPTLIIRPGRDDHDHPVKTAFQVHTLIKGSRIIEPPWPEDAWEQGGRDREAGTGGIFQAWKLAGPTFIDFIDGKEAGVATTLPWNA